MSLWGGASKLWPAWQPGSRHAGSRSRRDGWKCQLENMLWQVGFLWSHVARHAAKPPHLHIYLSRPHAADSWRLTERKTSSEWDAHFGPSHYLGDGINCVCCVGGKYIWLKGENRCIYKYQGRWMLVFLLGQKPKKKYFMMLHMLLYEILF